MRWLAMATAIIVPAAWYTVDAVAAHRDPVGVVEDYFEAILRRDVAAALAMVVDPPNGEQAALLDPRAISDDWALVSATVAHREDFYNRSIASVTVTLAGPDGTAEGDLRVVTVGRKGQAAMRRARVPIVASFDGFGDRPTFAAVVPLARLLTDDYVAGSYSVIDLIYPRFISTLSQRPVVDRLLPVEPSDTAAVGIPGRQFIFEPNPAEVLRQLMPRYVATRLFQAVLELTASEQSARMVAMKNATENAQELIDDLTLTYNKVRQANITREMIEIATGANAL